MLEDEVKEGLTFDDLLIMPAESRIMPKDVDTSTILTNKIPINIPLVSAAMDTVTESRTAICMAQEGGIGIIHRNMPIRSQVLEVDKVKKSESGMIVDPITVAPEQMVREALDLMSKYRISGVPVVKNKKLVGILTNRDLRFETDIDQPVSNVMTRENLVTVSADISLEESKKLLHRHRIEKLLVVDDEYNLKGLITIKDIEKIRKYPKACKDALGRLRVGAAVGILDREERVAALLAAGADVIIIDTSHGHSANVIDAIRDTKANFPGCELIAGNVATAEGAEALIRAGVDAIKVGVGPGSICTTRIIAGVGVPQMSAIRDCVRTAERHGIPVVADGGIKYSGDVVKALGAGAHSVMIGGLFAGTEESPGETIFFQGRSYKVYRGMGSLEAMKGGSRDRYFQDEMEGPLKLVPEGIEGRVPFRGSLSASVYQLIGGLKAGMGYTGSRTIGDLRKNARFIRITSAGLRESHVHDVIITKEAPNYWLD
ncbi:MAG TPA: IMP dehydrogenase [Syntrophales bacterium]|nr:IMP dehydrogenase [Syntrophales bacterium]HPX11067.1 IMP dehydrogenase [Syntrophales bacterium]HQN78037.1 IMP dehydrogenase [Syntrophales bacterium]HQQ26964.1 IMP dehydrogenase [Syntrophales bacterium]